MATKTHTSAVVIIPPPSVLPPIQKIRRAHDRHVRRWMPHVNLLYPFRPRGEFPTVQRELSAACAGLAPFEVVLKTFRFFTHHRASCTLWLEPEPGPEICALQEALMKVCPDCDDVAGHAGGFTPHLGVGQVRGDDAVGRAEELRADLQASWSPVMFRVDKVFLISRGQPPDDIFEPVATVALGGERP